jgi:hypothetical protein
MKIDKEQTHDYDQCLVKSLAFEGYNCTKQFCDWLFTEENKNSTVIAHNGGKCDHQFILQYVLSHGATPDKYMKQGPKIALMTFQRCNIRFIDSFSFFLCGLRKLPKNVQHPRGC